MGWRVYRNALRLIADGEINWDSDEIRIALVLDSYTPDLNADIEWSDVSAHEAAATAGYTTGGLIVPGTTEIYSNRLYCGVETGYAGGTAGFRWSVGAGGSLVFRYAVLRRVGAAGSALTDPLICYYDVSTGGNTTVGEFYNVDININGPYGPSVAPFFYFDGATT